MAKIKLIDEQITAIVVKELKKDYKLILNGFNVRNDDDLNEILDAIETLLNYYMIFVEAQQWIKEQKRPK